MGWIENGTGIFRSDCYGFNWMDEVRLRGFGISIVGCGIGEVEIMIWNFGFGGWLRFFVVMDKEYLLENIGTDR